MKKVALTLSLLGLLGAGAGLAVAQKGKSKGAKPKSAATKKGGVILRGEKIGAAERADLNEILQDPQAYAGKKVLIEGVISRSCTEMGCWMEIAAAPGGKSVRADTKHKFFIPLNAAGMKIKAEGTVAIKTLSKSEADHLEGEGAKVTRNEDGTANEIAFIATGVELSKK